jgi:hypothetical protein
MSNPSLSVAACLLSLVAIIPAHAATNSAEEINQLFESVGLSSCSFIRNKTAYSGAEARAHLERKYAHLKDRIQTTEDFIELVASSSSTSGKPYRVRCGPGEGRRSAEWFRTELQRIRGLSRDYR